MPKQSFSWDSPWKFKRTGKTAQGERLETFGEAANGLYGVYFDDSLPNCGLFTHLIVHSSRFFISAVYHMHPRLVNALSSQNRFQAVAFRAGAAYSGK
jgi:ribulose-5-phosphate 4-epimerase/fuculose-1-phosphate aldolase